MSRRLLAVLALVIALAVAVAFSGVESQSNRPSTLERRSRGLLAAYTYLERTGAAVSRWRRPLDELRPRAGATLVVAMPMRVALSPEELSALETWRLGGGRILLLAGSEAPEPEEAALLEALDLYAVARQGEPPLGWLAWRDWVQRELALEPTRPDRPGPVQIRAGRYTTRSDGAAEALYRDPDGAAAIYRVALKGQGAVLVVNNATALGNRWLGAGENLALLEALAAALPGPLIFDEWRQGHGLELPTQADVVTPTELIGLHLLLLYLAAAWALSRPFGPQSQRIDSRRGSVARDLEALATLHRAGGHAAQAGQRLLEIARERAGRRAGELGLPERFEGGEDGEDALVTLAQRVGQLQAERKL